MSESETPVDTAIEPTTFVDDSGTERLELGGEAAVALDFHARYARVAPLGRGGMGVVGLFHDRQIGRNVAIKTLTPHRRSPEARARFIHEARVQAQLEHPAIVPVYDLGLTPDEFGTPQPWFTMRRIGGSTLATVIKGLREQQLDGVRFGPRRLLTALAQVCLAIDYAHRHGVVHRDLKPENIMLGEWGEVYVLDWGLAELTSGEIVPARPELDGEALPARSGTFRRTSVSTRGRLLGTPCYVAPELLEGEPATPAADTYSLGAILFETLTLERLHPQTSVDEAVASTLAGIECRPSLRCPALGIEPEFDVILEATTARDPDARPSARALYDALQAVLDGQRDDEQRRRMIAAQTEHAARLLEGSPDQRSEAIRALGRALALDPGDPGVTTLLRKLLTATPRERPPEVTRALERSAAEHRKRSGRIAIFGYLMTLVYLVPLALWAGVRDPMLLALTIASMLSAALVSAWASLRPSTSNLHAQLVMLASNVGFATTAIFFGPLVLAPTLIATNTAAFAMVLTGRQRALALLGGVAAVLVPLALELADLTAPSYAFGEAGMLVLPRAVELAELPALGLLALGSIAGMLTGALAVGRVRDEWLAAEEQMHTWAWQVQQLVPRDAMIERERN